MSVAYPDVDILGDIDFDRVPVCEVLTQRPYDELLRPCRNEAVWSGIIPCCAFSLLVCQYHHGSPFPWSCRRCGSPVPDEAIRWRKL